MTPGPQDYEEHKELTDAARIRFKNGEIDELEFRKALGNLRFKATEIDEEVNQYKP